MDPPAADAIAPADDATSLAVGRLALGFLAKPVADGERVVAGVGPYAHYTVDAGLSLWHGMSGWAGQERRLAAWAERSGVALDYVTSADLDAGDGTPGEAALLLSVGHRLAPGALPRDEAPDGPPAPPPERRAT